jgi:hypothetical protein
VFFDDLSIPHTHPTPKEKYSKKSLLSFWDEY